MDPISPQWALLVKEHPVIIEAKTLATTLATKPGVDLHDVSSSARISILDWEDKEDPLGPCPLHLYPQGSQIPLDLAQTMLYHVIGSHVEKKWWIIVCF